MSKCTRKIEIVRVVASDEKGAVQAELAVKIDDFYLVQGIQIVTGKQGLFVSWPSWRESKEPGSSRFPIFNVEDEPTRWAFEIQMLEAYRMECIPHGTIIEEVED